MNKFVIIGAGYFGSNLAINLAQKGAEVIVLDINEKKIEALKNTVSKSVNVDARNKDMLAKLIPEDVDEAIVCIGRNLEANLIICLNLQSLGIQNITSKCHSEEHKRILQMMGVRNIINPEEEAAKMLANKLISSNILENIPLKDGFSMIEVKPPKDLIGKKLKDTNLRTKYGINIIGIRSPDATDPKKTTLNLTPDGDTVINSQDILIAIGKTEVLEKYFA